MDDSFKKLRKAMCSTSPIYRELKEAHDIARSTAEKAGVDSRELYDLLIGIRAST